MPEATGASCRLPGSPEAERSCTEQSRVRGLRTRDRERGRRGRGRRTVRSQPCSGLASVALHSSAGAVPRAQSPSPSLMRMPPQLWAPGTPSSGCCLRGGHRKPLPDARGGGGTDGSEAGVKPSRAEPPGAAGLSPSAEESAGGSRPGPCGRPAGAVQLRTGTGPSSQLLLVTLLPASGSSPHPACRLPPRACFEAFWGRPWARLGS